MADKSKYRPMTRDQAFIAAAVFMSIFVLWFLWAAVGREIDFSSEDSPKLTDWMQGISALVSAVAVCSTLWWQVRAQKRVESEKSKQEKYEFLLFLDSNENLISELRGFVLAFSYFDRSYDVMRMEKKEQFEGFLEHVNNFEKNYYSLKVVVDGAFSNVRDNYRGENKYFSLLRVVFNSYKFIDNFFVHNNMNKEDFLNYIKGIDDSGDVLNHMYVLDCKSRVSEHMRRVNLLKKYVDKIEIYIDLIEKDSK